ncbi:MAG: ATP-grasp domain-containing protein [Actinomycetota bacterium]
MTSSLQSISEPRVLVTGAGGPAGVAVLRALATEAQLFAVDMDACAVGLYLYLVGPERRSLVPAGHDPQFVDRLLELCDRWEIDVVIPTVDAELEPLAVRRAEFEAAGVDMMLGPIEALRTCLDKWELATAVADSPVRAPRTLLLDAGFDINAVPSWPAIIKPRCGSGSRGVRIIESSRDLEQVPMDGSHIIQEYLPGEELSVDVFVDRLGRLIGAVPRVRLKVDSGVSVAGRTLADPDAVALARYVAEAVGLRGPANVQCKRARDGRLALLEVNPRFPGSLPLTIASGFDIPRLALQDVRGEQLEPLDGFREVAQVRHWEDVEIPLDAMDSLRTATHPREVAA